MSLPDTPENICYELRKIAVTYILSEDELEAISVAICAINICNDMAVKFQDGLFNATEENERRDTYFQEHKSKLKNHVKEFSGKQIGTKEYIKNERRFK